MNKVFFFVLFTFIIYDIQRNQFYKMTLIIKIIQIIIIGIRYVVNCYYFTYNLFKKQNNDRNIIYLIKNNIIVRFMQ